MIKRMMVFILVSGSAAQAAQVRPVVTLPENIFSAEGFDDNDNVQLVLHGHFPNSCYKVGPATGEVGLNNTITVRNLTYVDKSSPCQTTVTSWSTVVSLGNVPQGNYRILALNSRGRTKFYRNVAVARATTSDPDESRYAQINDIVVTRDDQGKNPILKIYGQFSLDCLYLKEVRTVHKLSDVISILPIEDAKEGVPCRPMFIPTYFERSIPLEGITLADTLIHVRSAAGQALHRVYEAPVRQ